MGERDAREGKPIEAFFEVPIRRHSEASRASYEIGYRAEKSRMRSEETKKRGATVSIGMAVDCGKAETKLLLAGRLAAAAVEASTLNLYVNGEPAAQTFTAIEANLRANAAREGGLPLSGKSGSIERRFRVNLDMTDDGQEFLEEIASHGILCRKIGNTSHGWDTEFSSLTRESLEWMINQWWHSGDPVMDAQYLAEIETIPPALSEAQTSQIMLLLVGVGMPEAMAGGLVGNLFSKPWPDTADILRAEAGLEPKVIEAIRQIVGAEPIRFPRCTRTYFTDGARIEERCSGLAAEEGAACSRCGAASCERHEGSYPVYRVAEMNLSPEWIAKLASEGITFVCEDCLTPEETAAL